MKIIELLLKTKPGVDIFYHRDTKKFDYQPISDIQLKIIKQKGLEESCKLLEKTDDNNIRLPRYEELNHNDIMREFVKEFVDEKDTRKCLFGILSRIDYIDDFIQALIDFDLYELFEDVYSEYYGNIFNDWLRYNKIEL